MELGIKADSKEGDALFSGSPQVVNLLHKYAQMLEPSTISSLGIGDTVTPNTIQGQMDQIMHELNHIPRGSKEFRELNAKFDVLHRQKERMER
jgi:hypothetical protein